MYKGSPVFDGQRELLGYQQITDLSSATTLTAPAEAVFAIIAVTDQAVRWRDDGTDPTATIGMPEPVGMVFTYTGRMEAIKFIEQLSGAVINISYYA